MRNRRLKLSTHFRMSARSMRSRWRPILFLIAVALSVTVPPTHTAHAGPPAETPVDATTTSADSTHGVYLPQLSAGAAAARTACPAVFSALFNSVPVAGPPTDRPPHLHADLNLSLRGYLDAALRPRLVDINGPADTDTPQLAVISDAAANLDFVGTYQRPRLGLVL